MKELKELDEYTLQDLNNYCFGSGTTYCIKHEADAVMDAYENRIKELGESIKKFERRIQAYKELHDECVVHLMAIHWAFGHGELDKYIKDFETKWLDFKNDKDERIKELEAQSNKWEQDAYRQDERCLEYKKKYEASEARIKELEAKIKSNIN